MSTKRTVQFTIELIKFLKDKRKTILDPSKSWNKGNSDQAKTIVKMMIFLIDEWTISIDAIRKNLIPNCKHPKKMQTTCNGVKYCMNCNWDL